MKVSEGIEDINVGMISFCKVPLFDLLIFGKENSLQLIPDKSHIPFLFLFILSHLLLSSKKMVEGPAKETSQLEIKSRKTEDNLITCFVTETFNEMEKKNLEKGKLLSKCLQSVVIVKLEC